MIESVWQEALWEQFGAAIDMFDAVLVDCPEGLWQASVWPDDPGFSDFWYVSSDSFSANRNASPHAGLPNRRPMAV